ncbi:MAG: AraC family transcriptional regulator ligand-binding domain-containing protein [Moraxellaceae bacterium]|nr:AraC family transcriptional regulator ligand-binding domain-containing protein [Moraxellaceae bacterium]
MYRSQYVGSVSTSLLMMIVDFCMSHKLNIPRECLMYLNKNTLQPNDLTERIPFQIWSDVLANLYDQHPIDSLGLEIAKHIQLAHAGILSYLAFSKSKLSKAIPDFVEYNRLVYDFNLMHFHIENDHVELSSGDCRGRPGLLVDETAIALFYNIIKQAVYPLKISLKCLNFIYSIPKNIKVYEKYFECPVFFNAQSTSITFSFSEIEKIYLSRADPILYRLLKKQADRLIGQLDVYDDFEQRLYTSIHYCIKQKIISLNAVAKYMGVSDQILRKKLLDTGISFNKVLNKVRESLAKRYLSDQRLNIAEIADLLGYSEQSVFQRAFKNWTGETPLKFRNKIK